MIINFSINYYPLLYFKYFPRYFFSIKVKTKFIVIWFIDVFNLLLRLFNYFEF